MSHTEPAPTSTRPENAGEKRAYAAPVLAHLGSVRELTLGDTTGKSLDASNKPTKVAPLRKR